MRYFSKHFKLYGFHKPRTAQQIDSDVTMQFCCQDLIAGLCDPRTAIKYEPRLRDYWIIANPQKAMTIEFCPWCANKLPKELRNEYFDTLDHLLNDDTIDLMEDKNLPKEFWTDEWWKKRGL